MIQTLNALTLYILDTGIFLAYVRQGALGQRIEAQLSLLTTPATPLFCTVSEGEIRSIAVRSGWGPRRLRDLSTLLTLFTRVPLEMPGVIDAYVAIDVYSTTIGRPMGKNDLWIAAAANATGATLLTTDSDFEHLAPDFISRIRISPS